VNRGWLADERGALAAERILDAAAVVFADRGVAATGMAEVAAAAGCSRATLYRYFENRRALHVAFVHREARRVGALVSAEVAGVRDPTRRVVDAALAAIREVRATPVLAAWFRLGDAGIASELAHSSEVIEGLGAAFLSEPALGDPAEPDVTNRARWLVRVIVSLLTVPGESDADERAMLERFVAPLVVAPYTRA
jgi:AcrR family transcriptional regulator